MAVNGRTTAPVATGAPTLLVIPDLQINEFRVRLVGDAPLVVHRWSEKAKQQMREVQGKKAKKALPKRDPDEDYRESLYHYHEGRDMRDLAVWDGESYGFPAVAFKNAAITAVSQLSGVTKVFMRGAFHVNLGDEVVQVHGSPVMREDMVGLPRGGTDLRYRGEFFPWWTELDVRYNGQVVSEEQIVSLFETAGFAVGIGEGRPERNGVWGLFHVARHGEE